MGCSGSTPMEDGLGILSFSSCSTMQAQEPDDHDDDSCSNNTEKAMSTATTMIASNTYWTSNWNNFDEQPAGAQLEHCSNNDVPIVSDNGDSSINNIGNNDNNCSNYNDEDQHYLNTSDFTNVIENTQGNECGSEVFSSQLLWNHDYCVTAAAPLKPPSSSTILDLSFLSSPPTTSIQAQQARMQAQQQRKFQQPKTSELDIIKDEIMDLSVNQLYI